jgi:hypothetical protein
MKRALVVTLAILLAGAATYLVVRVRPWTVGPPVARATVEARWAQVHEWAALERRETGDAQLLVEAVAKLQADVGAVADFLRRREAAGRAAASPERVAAPASVAPAVALLVQWHAEGGGLGPKVAPLEPPRSVELLTLGRVALATAGPDPAAPARTAVLHLGRALRRNGTLVDAVVGFKLAGEAGPPCTGPFAPERGELFPALAAEAVRTYESIAAELQRSPRPAGWPPRTEGRPRIAPVPVERELLMLKWHLGEVLHDAWPLRDDPERLVALLEARARREDPRSTLVDIASPVATYGVLLRQMAATMRACQAGRGPARPPAR